MYINKANDTNEAYEKTKNLLNAGVEVTVSQQTCLHLAMAVTIPAIIIILLLMLKDYLKKL